MEEADLAGSRKVEMKTPFLSNVLWKYHCRKGACLGGMISVRYERYLGGMISVRYERYLGGIVDHATLEHVV